MQQKGKATFCVDKFVPAKHIILKKHTFTLRNVSIPRFPLGCTTAKYLSKAKARSVSIEASAPVHANPPPVINAHRIVPAIPFGWSTSGRKIIVGVTNVT